MRVVVALGLGSLVAFIAGCPAHVMLDPPPPALAPAEVRESYYETHAPERPERGELVVRTRVGQSAPTFTQKVVRLRNGARIVDVEDLAPLVDAQSDTGKAIATSLEARGRADAITTAGLAAGGVGIVAGGALFSSFLLQKGLNNQGSLTGQLNPLLIGGVSTAVVGVVGGSALVAWGLSVRDDEEDARMVAFKTFDRSLRARLALPSDPAAATAPAPTPAPATPAPEKPETPAPDPAPTPAPSGSEPTTP